MAYGVVPALPAAAASESLADINVAQKQALAAVTVAPGQAELRRYSREPGTVIVGDSEVAAASLAASDILVLTGLEPGETNVIVLDDDGAEIDHIALRVAERGTTIVVRRGQERELLRCDPACAPLDGMGLHAPASRQFDPRPTSDIPVADGNVPQL
ncbi:pilus assembly protein N-terminal domain-containing protein [Roseitranquillus sediminis]|uniref:pilus assembly protein N-terminal domain-containing protein n=1 Tax=Roseitranquillus sediminis TaxID=2809051 RepID=UPI001D0C2332|nr:pilus assembly protein N-terminal domain-containing protein [Roseitranquillus sediminis]